MPLGTTSLATATVVESIHATLLPACALLAACSDLEFLNPGVTISAPTMLQP